LKQLWKGSYITFGDLRQQRFLVTRVASTVSGVAPICIPLKAYRPAKGREPACDSFAQSLAQSAN